MNRVREKKEETGEKQAAKAGASAPARLPKALIDVLNGSFLTRDNVLGNMPFILFCAGLMLLYITYGYTTERIVRELHRTDAELKELRSEYITVRAKLEQQEQQSQVAAGISALGLRESRVPPVKIAVDEDMLENTTRP
jgi:hypothetical protein